MCARNLPCYVTFSNRNVLRISNFEVFSKHSADRGNVIFGDMIELPSLPAVCSSTRPWMEQWRSKTCKKILRAKKITSKFKDEPKIDDKIIEDFKRSLKRSMASTYTVKLRRVLDECRDKIVQCSKEKVLIGSFIVKVEDVLASFDYSYFSNKSNIAKRQLRPTPEMRKEDCPDILLREEKRALKQSREIFVIHLKSLKDAILKLNALQQELEDCVRSTRKIEKIFDVRFVTNIALEKVKEMYCELPGQHYPLTEEDLERIVQNYCTLASRLVKAMQESKETVSKIKEHINDVIKKRDKITEAVNKNMADKIAQTEFLKKELEEAQRETLPYQCYYNKKFHKADMVLRYAPHCKHVRDYVEDTGKNLWKLYKNRKSIIEEILVKSKTLHIDKGIMTRRKRDMKQVDVFKSG